MEQSQPPGDSAGSPMREVRLGSWKEIANYLGRTVRTVQRWEQNEGLPVRRHQHDSGSSVFAFKHELDRWLTRRSLVVHDAPRQGEQARQAPEAPAQTPATAELPADAGPGARRFLWPAVGLVLILAVTLALLSGKDEPEVEHHLPRSLTTKPGIERFPALAPDGRHVAYVWADENGQVDLYLRLVDVEEHIRLTNDEAIEESPAWSPDGLSIAYLRRAGAATRELRVIPAIGGSSRAIATLPVSAAMDTARSIAASVAWSPDGEWLVTNRGQDGPEIMGLVAINVSSNEEARLTWPDADTVDLSPEFSRDGRFLAFARSPSALKASIHVMEFDSAAPGPGRSWKLPDATPFNSDPAWTVDDQSLVFSSGRWPRVRLFHMPADGSAEPAPITGTGMGGSQPSISRLNGESGSPGAWRMVYMVQAMENDIWRIGLQEQGESVLLTTSQRERYPSWARDGRIAFLSDRSGHREIWVANSDGEQWQQWTDLQSAYVWRPTFSPDGSQLAYSVEIDNVHVLQLQDGPLAPPRKLTPDGFNDHDLAWSRDGQRLYAYSNNRGGAPALWVYELEGGEPRKLADGNWLPLGEDPDGVHLYATRSSEGGGPAVHRMDTTTGEYSTIELAVVAPHSITLGPDGVYFISRGADAWEIHRWDWSTGEQTRLQELLHVPETGMAISPDGAHALLARIVLQRSDLMVLDSR